MILPGSVCRVDFTGATSQEVTSLHPWRDLVFLDSGR